jgi:hypothetical protein
LSLQNFLFLNWDYFKFSENQSSKWIHAMEVGMGITSHASGDISLKTPLFGNLEQYQFFSKNIGFK